MEASCERSRPSPPSTGEPRASASGCSTKPASVLAERRSDEGMLAAAAGRLCAHPRSASRPRWARRPTCRSIICGMAGSRQGWVEAPYVAVPGLASTAYSPAPVRIAGSHRDIRILPGVAQRDPASPDVMRGEETQLAGIASLLGSDTHIVCMPGTHSKWVESPAAPSPASPPSMTGELFSVLSAHSILATRSARVPPGLARRPGLPALVPATAWPSRAMSAHGFSASAPPTLLTDMQPDQAAAALSGLLIGAESLRRAAASPGPARRSSWSRPARWRRSTRRRSAGRLSSRHRSTPTRRCAPACSPRRAISAWTPAGATHDMSAPFPKLTRGLVAILRGLRPARGGRHGRGRVRSRHRGDRGAAQLARPVHLDRDASSPALPSSALLGAGTVLTAEQVDRLARRRRPAAGQPQYRCRRHASRRRIIGMVTMPGVFTPTEAFQASAPRRIGAEILPGQRARAEGHRRDQAVLPADAVVGAVGGVSDKRLRRLCEDRRPHVRPRLQPLQARHERGGGAANAPWPRSPPGDARLRKGVMS